MLKIYHAPRTRSVRILWLLQELGLPYEIEPVALRRPSPGRPGHALRQSAGGGDGDVQMIESGAMVEYLLERTGTAGSRRRSAMPIAPPYLQWLHFAESTAFAPISGWWCG